MISCLARLCDRPGLATAAAALISAMLLFSLVRSTPVGAEIAFIPIPYVSSVPNEGPSYGVMPVLMMHEGDVTTGIFAPAIDYNEALGVSFAFRYFGYPRSGRTYAFKAGQSTEDQSDYYAWFEDPGILGGRMAMRVELTYINDRVRRFYGFGSNSSEDDETNFTQGEIGFVGWVGYNIIPTFQARWTERFRFIRIGRGVLDEVPPVWELFPDAPGLDEPFISAHRLTLIYDTRDSVESPTEGEYIGGFFEISDERLGSETSFRRYGVDLRKLIPSPRRKLILVFRALLEVLNGDRIPFYEQSTLGGDSDLRGFGLARFVDKNKFIVSVEGRYRVLELHWFGLLSEIELAPFVDMGQVFRSFQLFEFEHFQFVGGAGFRAVVHPRVVASVAAGMGREGINVFATLGYPF